VQGERGQATVELLAVVPALVALGLIGWQLILVGHAAWMSAQAARAAARADLVDADAEAAARAVLPRGSEAGLRLGRDGSGRTRVELPVPILHPSWRGPVTVTARTSLEAVR
jgi:pilus assembly protein CpaE